MPVAVAIHVKNKVKNRLQAAHLSNRLKINVIAPNARLVLSARAVQNGQPDRNAQNDQAPPRKKQAALVPQRARPIKPLSVRQNLRATQHTHEQRPSRPTELRRNSVPKQTLSQAPNLPAKRRKPYCATAKHAMACASSPMVVWFRPSARYLHPPRAANVWRIPICTSNLCVMSEPLQKLRAMRQRHRARNSIAHLHRRARPAVFAFPNIWPTKGCARVVKPMPTLKKVGSRSMANG